MSFQSIKKCISNHCQFVSDSNKLSTPVAELCLQLHSSIRELERQYGLQKSKSALQSLYLENMDEDQIWEQMAANDDQLMDLDSEGNLCMTVSDVKLLAEKDSSKHQLLADVQLSPFNIADTEKKQMSESEDEGLHNTSLSHTEDDEDDIDDEDFNALDSDVNEDEDDEEMENDEDDEEMENDEDGEEMENDEDELLSHLSKEDDEDTALASDSDEEGIENIFNKYNKNNDDSDDEVDDFDELALASGEESESDNDIENIRNGKNQTDSDSDSEKTELKKKDTSKKLSKGNLLKKITVPKFTKTSVDSEFFNVRESEWIADEDILGANNFDDIDFMEDIGDEEEQATYRDFFDDIASSNTNKKSSSKRKSSKSKGTSSGDADDVNGDDNPESWGLQDAEAGSEDTPQTATACVAQQSKSRLEAELEAEAKLRERLEESNIGEKPWALKGEVRAVDRPVDSVMTEYLEYKSGDKRRPVIDDAVTRRLEKIALVRFRTKAFDSVERKARLVEDAFEYKKKIVLDQEKSSKSLSKIYEEEYLKKQRSDAVRSAEEEPPEQKQFKKDFEEYEEMTRALSNAHYTPKMLQAEVKIVSNQPALRVEEAMPDVVGDADVLAPQEILAPVRGTLKGDSEKTTTDKKRERRDKKHRQHLKYNQLNKRLDAKVKKAEKDGKKLDVDTSAKVVKRALKIGQVVMMDKQGASVKSSTSFFKQLHEQHSAASSAHAKKRKRENK